ncbi:hypothetical protein, partial [Pseudoalteromonas ruthenica]
MANFNKSQARYIGAYPYAPSISVSNESYEQLADDELIFESVPLEDIESLVFAGLPQEDLMTEAVTTRRNRIERTMKAFNRKFTQALAGTGIAALEPEIGKVRKAAGFAILAAKIPTDDGQSISIIFHAPDNDPAKITPDDLLIAFRFLLNKRDVTHVVAPAGGHEISLAQVTMALSNLVERNSAKFKKKAAEKDKQQGELDALNSEIEKIEEEKTEKGKALKDAQAQLSEEKKRNSSVSGLLKKQKNKNAELEKQIKAAQEKQKPKVENFVSDNIKEKARTTTLMQFTAWATKTLGLPEKEAAALHKQAKDELKTLSDNLAAEKGDEVTAAVRSMTLADFTDWAKEHIKTTPHDAEVLYNQVREQLKAEHEQKLLEQPNNKLMQQVHDALVAKYNSKMIKLYKDLRHPSVSIQTAVHSLRINVFERSKDEGFELDLATDAEEQELIHRIASPDGVATKEELDKLLDAVDRYYKKYGSELVDLANLPEYGSNSGKGGYGSELNKELRVAIKEAIANSNLPKGITVTVKGDIGVTVRKLPDSIQLFSDKYLKSLANDAPLELRGGYDSNHQGQYSADATALLKLIDATVNSYQKTYGDPQDMGADYGVSKRFYFYGADFASGLESDRKLVELEAYKEKHEQPAEGEAQPHEPEQGDNTDKIGEHFDPEASISDIAKAVRKALADSAKDTTSKIHGTKATVKKGKSTHTDKLTVTIKKMTGENDAKEVIAAIEQLLSSYNKITGSGMDDSTSMRFIPEVINDAMPEPEPEPEP